MASTIATIPSCQEPPGSLAANESGRNTDRIPSAIQRSGNSDAICWSPVGSSPNWNQMPEMNCNATNGKVTTADAERGSVTIVEIAIPSSTADVRPSRNPHENV